LRNKSWENIDMPGSKKLRGLKVAELAEEQRRGTLILDTRPAEQFTSLHVRGSIQISLLGYFASWAAILIDPTTNLILIAEDENHASEACGRLTRVGIERVIGFSVANEREWCMGGIALGSVSVHRCENVDPMTADNPSPQLVDVRSRAEWLKGHLPGAISVPLLELGSGRGSIDPARENIVYCHEGYRATTAASILLRETTCNISILIDGVEGWSASGRPLELPETA